MIAAARDAQRPAQLVNGTLGLHGFYPLESLPDGSEIMPKVFLECSAAAPSGATAGSRPAGHLAGGQGLLNFFATSAW